MEIGSSALGLLISVPINGIRINLAEADLENETFVWMIIIIILFNMTPCDSCLQCFTSVQLYRNSLHGEKYIQSIHLSENREYV